MITVEHAFLNGQKTIFAGTHFCKQFAENRLDQTESICNLLNDCEISVIISCDFNFSPDSESYKLIRNCFNDAADVKGNPENTIPFYYSSVRIDYISVSKKAQLDN